MYPTLRYSIIRVHSKHQNSPGIQQSNKSRDSARVGGRYVVQDHWGHWCWSQSKARMPLTSSKNNSLGYILFRTIFQLARSIGQIVAFNRGCLSLLHSFSVIFANVAINHILPKARLFGQHFCRRKCESSFNRLTYLALKLNAFKTSKH